MQQKYGIVLKKDTVKFCKFSGLSMAVQKKALNILFSAQFFVLTVLFSGGRRVQSWGEADALLQ
jgi:hypothetical protein